MTTEVFLDTFVLSAARAFGFVALWPLDHAHSAFHLKLLFAVMLAFVGADISTSAPAVLSLGGIVSEFMFGLLLFIPLLFVISLIEWWAEIFDTGRGQNLGSVLDPMQQSESNAFALLLRSAAWIIMLSSSIFLHVIGLLFRSYYRLPLGNLSGVWNQELFARFLLVMHEGVSTMLWVILPFTTLFLLVELVMALSSKLLPSVSLNQESFMIKTALSAGGLAILATTSLTEFLVHTTLRLLFMDQMYG